MQVRRGERRRDGHLLVVHVACACACVVCGIVWYSVVCTVCLRSSFFIDYSTLTHTYALYSLLPFFLLPLFSLLSFQFTCRAKGRVHLLPIPIRRLRRTVLHSKVNRFIIEFDSTLLYVLWLSLSLCMCSFCSSGLLHVFLSFSSSSPPPFFFISTSPFSDFKPLEIVLFVLFVLFVLCVVSALSQAWYC